MTKFIRVGLLTTSMMVHSGYATVAQAQAQAQAEPPTAPSDPATSDPSDIVVTGIRASLDRALDIKREANGFVDAISAEDVGKLPDQNIAEALQRVTGVSIQRSRGEGDFVTIRGLGPTFVRGTINGRSLVSTTESRDGTRSGGFESSTGRETNFDILPAEIIARVEVVKSPSASYVEGGIGGVVDVVTQRPLALGTSLTASAKGTYRDFNEAIDPAASGLVSYANESRTFGVLAAVSYSERSIKEEAADSFGYATFGPNVDTDANGTADRNALSFPFSFNPQSIDEKRKRFTAQGTFQARFSDRDEVIVDLLYSSRDLNSRALIPIIGTCCGFLGNVNGNGITNPDGSIQIPGIKIEGASAVGYQLSSQVSTNTDDQIVKDRLFSIGGSYIRTTDDWTLGLDVSYASSKGDLDFQRVSLTTIANVPFDLTISNDQLQPRLRAGGPALSNLASYRTNNADVVERSNRDKEFAAGVNATRSLGEASFLSAIKFGAHYRTRNVNREDRTSFNVNTDQISATGLGAGGTVRFQGPFVRGRSSFPFSDLLFGDVASQQALLLANNPNARFVSTFSAPQSFRIKESTIGGYVQADIDGALGSIPIKGNFGVRVVQTNTDITGFFQPFRIDNNAANNNLGSIVILDPTITTNTISNSYINVLPTLNLSAELADRLLLRFAAGRSVTRPTFLQLAPGLSNINPTQRFASSGNPQLRAYESTNVDLGLEWYFDRGSAIYISAFAKQIDDFVGVSTTLNVTRFGVNFNSISQPANQGKAEIVGLEAGVQKAFDFGLGFILNATLIDSKAEFTEGVNAGRAIPLQGVSDFSYNATVYYEKSGFSTRLAYSHRSKFTLLASDVFGNTLIGAPYGQLDASVGYTFDDRFTIFGNAVNLTNSASRVYSDRPSQPLAYSLVGRRFEAGVRVKF